MWKGLSAVLRLALKTLVSHLVCCRRDADVANVGKVIVVPRWEAAPAELPGPVDAGRRSRRLAGKHLRRSFPHLRRAPPAAGRVCGRARCAHEALDYVCRLRQLPRRILGRVPPQRHGPHDGGRRILRRRLVGCVAEPAEHLAKVRRARERPRGPRPALAQAALASRRRGRA